MSFYIYGKHPVAEFLGLYPQEALRLWYLNREDLARYIIPPHCEVCQAESHSTLARNFRLKEFESHQGLILEIKRPIEDFLLESVEEAVMNASQKRKHLLWLPSIKDGHNLGAVSRNCVAFDRIYGLIIPSRGGPKLSPSVAKVSAGTIFHLRYSLQTSLTRTLRTLKLSQLKLIALQQTPKAQPLQMIDFRGPETIVFILGDEEQGIPPEILRESDLQVAIPQSTKVDSLNLSVASGILLYAYAQKA